MKPFKTLLILWALSSQVQAQVEMETWSSVESSGRNFDPVKIESLPNKKFQVGGISYWYNIGKYTEYRGYFFSMAKHMENGLKDPSFPSSYFYGINEFMSQNRTLQGKDWVRLPNNNIFMIGKERKAHQEQLFVSIISENGQSATSPKFHGPALPNLEIANLAMLENGDIVAGGYGTNPSTGGQDFFLIKLNQEGEQLPLKGSKQILWFNHGTSDTCTRVVTGDFGIYLCGHTKDNDRSKFLVFGTDKDGYSKQDFGLEGKSIFSVSTSGNDRLLHASWHHNKTLFLVGASNVYTTKFRDVISVANLNAMGQLNTKFDYDGKAFIYVGGGNDRGYDIDIAKDGSVYIAGATQEYNGYKPLVIHMSEDGKLDPSFGSKGIFKFNTTLYFDQGYWGKFNVSMDLTQDDKILLAAGQSQKYWTARLRQPEAISPAGFSVSYVEPCSGEISITPKNLTGTHYWTFGDGESSGDATPRHSYRESGKYFVTHTYIDNSNKTHSYYQYIEVGKTPYFTTVGEYMLPTFANRPTVVRVQNPNVGENYNLQWSPSTAITELGYNNTSASFQFNTPGFYEVSVTATPKGASNYGCSKTITDTLIIPPYFDACSYLDPEGENSRQIGFNQVINGTFDDNTCPPTTFSSQFPFKCQLGGANEPEKVGIVSNVKEYSDYYNVPDSVGDHYYSLSSLSGNFLLIAERTESKGEWFGRYEKIKNRTAWSQQVYVNEGAKYLFKSGFANINKHVFNEYSFPQFYLVVDNEPIAGTMLTGGVESLCGYYTATKSGWVTIEIIRQNGFWFTDGHAALDNIEFYGIYYPPHLRKEEGTAGAINAYPNSTFDKLEVNIHSETNVTVQIVEAMTGRVRSTAKINSTNASLDISYLENGVFISRFMDDNGKFLGSKKFAVVK